MSAHKVWDEETVIRALQEFREREGRQPSMADTRTPIANKLPSGDTVCRVFDSWSNAVLAAGMEPFPRGGEFRAKDDETRTLMQRVLIGGETLVDVARDAGVTGQALGRRIQRYRRAFGLGEVRLPPGRRSPA